MTRRIDRLFVLWSDPGQVREGQRHVIGELWRDAREGFAFAYAADLSGATKAGFSPGGEFPELRHAEQPYRSRHLFWTFAERIPSPRRPDYRQLMESWGVQQPDDQFEVLALSGGVQTTDRLELAEYRADDDDLTDVLRFRLAGERHCAGVEELAAGDSLELRVEPENKFDSHATQVLFRGDQKIGYVPVQYAKIFSALLRQWRRLEARAERRLLLPAERGRWVIAARRA